MMTGKVLTGQDSGLWKDLSCQGTFPYHFSGCTYLVELGFISGAGPCGNVECSVDVRMDDTATLQKLEPLPHPSPQPPAFIYFKL